MSFFSCVVNSPSIFIGGVESIFSLCCCPCEGSLVNLSASFFRKEVAVEYKTRFEHDCFVVVVRQRFGRLAG